MYWILAVLLSFMACSKTPSTPTPPPPIPTPSPTPTETPVGWWRPKAVKSFQIFHFQDFENFKKKLKEGTEVVTLELDQIEMPESQGKVVAYAHAQGTKVICYTSQGYEDWRSDAHQYPKDAMGKEMDDWKGERWGDPRKDSLLAFIGKRMDRCKALGADGIELDNADQHANTSESGIKISKEENIWAQKRFADLAHSKGLAIFAKNSGNISADLASSHDGVFVESCNKYKECEDYLPFKGKLVAMLEYGLTPCKPFEGAVCERRSGYFK